MSDQVLAYATPRATPMGAPLLSAGARLVFGGLGVVLPCICLGLAIVFMPLAPEWQSGRWHDKVAMFLSGGVGWPFYPLLAYCIISMAKLVGAPHRLTRPPIRMGIYAGVPLALQYSLLMFATLFGSQITSRSIGLYVGIALLVWSAPLAGLWLLRQAARRVRMAWVPVFIAGLIGLAVVIFRQRLLGGIVFVPLAAASGWALSVYVAASVFVWRNAASLDGHKADASASASRFWLIVPSAWAAAYLLAWRAAIYLQVKEYAALPTKPPGCYVCTAAARGHAGIVRARPIRVAGGVILVNDQMRRLKLAELALMALSPWLHGALRRSYDRVGPLLASWLVTPVLADAAYLLLKPAEWTSFLLICGIVPDADRIAGSLYRSS